MKNANLILHCGAAHVDRAVISTIATPEHTETWYPIPHIDFITGLMDAQVGFTYRTEKDLTAGVTDAEAAVNN
jgi:hypothetical protein